METTIGGEAHHFYGLGSANFRTKGKRSPEWDPNDWKWDGDLFVASHLNPNPSDFQSRQFFPLESGVPTAGASSNSSSTSSDELDLGIEKAKRDLEKRRRVIVVEDDNLEDEAGSLSLKLGGHTTERVVVENWDGANGKKARVVGTTLHRAVCQVENCRSDLSKAKDYHRRHKVCEMHSKAGKALVGNVMQRFCQQCSRFHALQEFDEGKRSCRRRLAGHNKRRRKTQPDAPVNSESSNDNQASGYLLITLLRILSNMHSNANQTDPDLLSHLVRSLSSCGGIQGGENINGLLLESHNLLKNNISAANSEMVSALQSNGLQVPPRPKQQHRRLIGSVIPQERLPVEDTSFQDIQTASSQRPRFLFPIQDSPTYPETRDSSAGKSKLNNFDLNDIYIDSDDAIEVDRYPVHVDLGTGSLECPSWVQQNSHQSSPPQTSGNSDSASAQSPSISTGDAQSRTDRIVFKLFGKDPSDFPFVLRAQILDWLSHSPTDIESYIRPGCIILTIYLRMPESVWEELCCDLSSSLSRLLEISDDDTFWRTGWVYVRVQNQIAFIYNGQVVVDTSLPFKSKHYSTILSVSPIAVSVSEKTQFLVKGFNFSRPSMRLMCALEGNYLIPGANHGLVEDVEEQNDLQYMNFSCSIPAVAGRGFIEVEDHGLSSSFFPFIVAEKEVCSEICMLESEMELTQSGDILGGNGQSEARNLAMDFIHEMGWLLRSSQLKSRFGHLNTNSGLFPFNRFKWLMEFSMDHDWSAVVKKLLNILFDGTVGLGEHQFLKLALNEMGLLHRAVRRNSRPLVELLLSYVPEKVVDGLTVAGGESESVSGSEGSFFFRPDIVGPAGLTPLHVAAGRDGSEDVIDALTNDPGKVGVEAWRNCHDSTGFTPEDYARLRGHYSYIHLIQKKIVSRKLVHVVLEIPPAAALPCSNSKQKLNDASFGVERVGPCKRCCDHRHKYGSAISSRYRVARPAMLSMVAIAAVCVCVALLFKSSPQVFCVFRPFRWEMLDFGSI